MKKSYYYAHAQVMALWDHADPDGDGVFDDLYFYMHDRLGSVRQVIDESAAVMHYYTYDPYGELLESVTAPNAPANAFLFTGQWYDPEIGQYHLRARMYDPALMRFTTRDPYIGERKRPFTLHRYLYCQNDPVNNVDISGWLMEQPLESISFGMKMYEAADYAKTVKTYAQQILSGASLQGVMISIAVDIGIELAGGKVADRLLDWTGGMTRKINKSFDWHNQRLGVTSGKKGHHLLPEWLGGNARQLTVRFPDGSMHTEVLEKRIRARMSKYNDTFTIGGEMTAAESFEAILKSGRTPEVLNDLADVYKEFDNEFGTNLIEGLAINIVEGGGDKILMAIKGCGL